MLKNFIALLLFLATSLNINSQVVINEYSSSNLRDYEDNYGKHEDWIELYNTTAQAIDIGGWYLSDKESKPKKYKIPSGVIIDPYSYLVVWASGRDEYKDGFIHTNFKFTQTDGNEFAVLTNKSGSVIEKFSLVNTSLGHSIAKKTDGSGPMKICIFPTPGYSNNASSFFDDYTKAPKILTPGGFYHDSVRVDISIDDDSNIIRYTLDGSFPDNLSPQWTGSIIIKTTVIFKVRAFSNNSNILPGLIDFETYFVNEPPSSLPVFSVSGNSDVLDLANGNASLNPVATVEAFDITGNKTSESYGELDNHGQDSWVNPQRSIDWISRDEMGYDSGLKQKLFDYSEREDYQRFIFRASGDDNYPAIEDEAHAGSTHTRDEYVHTLVQNSAMLLDVRAVKRCLLYLNGQYWGVYTIREKPDDHDYTDFTYKQDKYDLQYLETWGFSWAQYGDATAMLDWVGLRDKILSNDVSNPDFYRQITDQLDVMSLMDYMIANLSVVSADWINYNTGWWRGMNPEGKHTKWGYIMWDNDATFDYYINYSGVPDRSPNAKACDLVAIGEYMDVFFPIDTSTVIYPADSFFIDGQWYYYEADTVTVYPDLGQHEKIFLKLLENNEVFRNQYFERYADMLNTAFTCENMLKVLDSLVNIIRPEMPRHIARWGRSEEEWEKNIANLRSYVEERCQKIDDGLSDCYNLSGPFTMTLNTYPQNMGNIRLNTLTHYTLPWSGNYFGNMSNEIEVNPISENKFLFWKSSTGKTIINSPLDTRTTFVATDQDTLIAVFDDSGSNVNDIKIDRITIHPNPASGEIALSIENAGSKIMNLEITDLNGKLVFSKLINFENSTYKLNLDNINSGMYLIKCHDSDHDYYGKMIKVN